ncbi:MAG: hypothetical protein E6J16_12985 [Chloroflexota bacterium]|nr:MAG: hypothetical protein E6J16_12985 [Chloroflexota bacterium]
MITPPVYGFSAEVRGEHPAFDDFDDYLRLEFAKQHPGWEPRFGKATWFDPAVDRYDYMYLLHGNVPEAKTHEEAEKKVRELLDEIAHGLKSVRPAVEKAIPRPLVRVWRWH